MSHLVKQKSEVKITDLDTLDLACQRLGLKLEKAKKTASYYGKAKTSCDAVISCPNSDYEIALHKQKDGSYDIEADLYCSTLRNAVSHDMTGSYVEAECNKLFEAYKIQELTGDAASNGFSSVETWDPDQQRWVLEFER